jgi:hypothetical protein
MDNIILKNIYFLDTFEQKYYDNFDNKNMKMFISYFYSKNR